jgi:hypothetical protein
MAVRQDCRHYVRRTTPGGDRMEQCKLAANTSDPFACPEGCLFFEPRKVADQGWQIRDPRPGEGS